MEEKEKTTTTAPEEQAEAAAEETNELETLKAELEKLKKEKDELNDRYLRTLAEYDNFRKRSQREKDAVYGDATADAVKKLLPILDSFDASRGAVLNRGERLQNNRAHRTRPDGLRKAHPAS